MITVPINARRCVWLFPSFIRYNFVPFLTIRRSIRSSVMTPLLLKHTRQKTRVKRRLVEASNSDTGRYRIERRHWLTESVKLVGNACLSTCGIVIPHDSTSWLHSTDDSTSWFHKYASRFQRILMEIWTVRSAIIKTGPSSLNLTWRQTPTSTFQINFEDPRALSANYTIYLLQLWSPVPSKPLPHQPYTLKSPIQSTKT